MHGPRASCAALLPPLLLRACAPTARPTACGDLRAGNTQTAEEEVRAIAGLCSELLGATLDDGGETRPMTLEDILIVAPYNLQVRARAPLAASHRISPDLSSICDASSAMRRLQVRALSAALGGAARVGTVDRFQGQEAPVVIVSLCHSRWERVQGQCRERVQRLVSSGGNARPRLERKREVTAPEAIARK